MLPGSNVMRSIHGVGELMSQVVLRGGGFLPPSSTRAPNGDAVKTQTEPEKQDILVMDTKLKIIEILQVEDIQCSNIVILQYNLNKYSTLYMYVVCFCFFSSLQFILNVRLDYRISCLLSIFKREFDESNSQNDISLAGAVEGPNNMPGLE